MRVDLVELLRMREIRHPSRIVLLESRCASDVRIEVAGYPWWLEDPQVDRDEKITFHIDGITDGALNSDVIHADSSDEDLESFDVRALSEHGWAKGVHCDVYCSTSLKNPFGVYAVLHDFLLSVNCPYSPGNYLNLGNSGSLNEFESIASSGSFLLCSGPEAVCQVVCKMLVKYGAKFNIVKGKDLSNDLICVRLRDSHLICQSAYAIFEGRSYGF